MARESEHSGGQRGSPWRIAAWSFAVSLLLLPLVAMQFTSEVNWDALDFIFAGILIGGVGLAFELAVRKSRNYAYRAAIGFALAAAFLLVWISAAVGIIGDSDNPANLMYLGVLALALGGAIIARFQADGMARALAATALAHASVGVIALVAGLGSTEPPGPLGILILNGFFTALWLLSAWLFRKAALVQSPAVAAS